MDDRPNHYIVSSTNGHTKKKFNSWRPCRFTCTCKQFLGTRTQYL